MAQSSPDNRFSKYGFPTMTGSVVLLVLYASSRYSHLLFHNIVELTSVLIAFLVFTLVWNTRRVLDNQYLLFIGIAFLFTGLLDLVHTYAYNKIGIFRDTNIDLVTQLWIAYRYIFSATFFLAPFFINRRTNAGTIFTCYLVIASVLIGAVFFGWFPACYSENTGMTRFKIISEYVVSFILLASFGLLYRKRAAFDRTVYFLLSGSILASMFSALSYTQYVIVVNFANVIGHIADLLADFLIYRAVVVTGVIDPATILFRKLKQSEETVRESEERYRSLIELSPDAIIVHCAGKFVYGNSAAAKLVGAADSGELIGREVLDFIHPEYREAARERMRLSYEQKMQSPTQQMVILRIDGKPVDVEVSSVPTTHDCKPATQVVIRDITDRKRVEEALQRAHTELEMRVQVRTEQLARTNRELQEEIAIRQKAEAGQARLVSAVESTAEAVLITDPTTGIIQYVNPAFEMMTGYTKGETLGRTIHFLDSGTHDKKYYQGLKEALQHRGVWSGKLVNKKKDGTLYFEECTVSPVKDRDGTIINYVYVKRDVTEKLRLESIAESVNTMNNIGYVFSGVRHEIGNPINSINMILGILRAKLDSLPTESVKDYLSRVSEQVSRVEYLLRSLKSFNLYETQEPGNVQLSSFVEKFLSLIAEDLDKKGIAVETAIDPGVRFVYADPRALQQVFLNVITNAMDALRGRNDPKIRIIVHSSDSAVKIKVQDNGEGIPDEKKEEIFKPFYTTKEQGTGLGLVIVKKMLATMNGTIEIESRKDKGTTVIISVPGGVNEGR